MIGGPETLKEFVAFSMSNIWETGLFAITRYGHLAVFDVQLTDRQKKAIDDYEIHSAWTLDDDPQNRYRETEKS